MHDNERGYHHLHKIDKGIQHIDHPQRASTDLPSPLRGDAPMREGPHDAGPRMPVHIPPRRLPEDRPPGLLRDNGPLNPNPHPYNPASQVQQRNTYAAPTWERKLK